jgi:hypothetical protein
MNAHNQKVKEIIATLKKPNAKEMNHVEFFIRWLIVISGTFFGLWTYLYN